MGEKNVDREGRGVAGLARGLLAWGREKWEERFCPKPQQQMAECGNRWRAGAESEGSRSGSLFFGWWIYWWARFLLRSSWICVFELLRPFLVGMHVGE
jgi:hypothetical protein